MTESDERQYTLQELASAAGVSIRTIRYYIGEGLLPAPIGAGPQSHYTQSHLDRLRVIGLMKDRYLPLREIRKALSGLDDQQIDRLITDLDDDGPPASPDVIQRRGQPLRLPAAPAFLREEPDSTYDALSYIDSALDQVGAGRQRVRRSRGEERRPPEPDAAVWRKLDVADGVELLVRDDIYRRRGEQIDWLIDWAKKVVE